MILGAITNSWKEQLSTTDLPRLVERAQRRGAAHIELRQSFLGQYEGGADEDWRPVSDKLGRLVRTFPVLTFNLAVACPCITGGEAPDSPRFQASLAGALVTSGSAFPSLRLVDPARFEKVWETPQDVLAASTQVAQLTKESARWGVRLFIENSGHPIRSMALLADGARKQLANDEAPYLGLCVDPINSMRADPDSDPIDEVQALPTDQIFMVHFKQTRNAQPHPAVDEGDLDYARLLKVLEAKGYEGLAVLEIPSGEDVFENFRQSVAYLQGLMASH